jgi:hypothetical protein
LKSSNLLSRIVIANSFLIIGAAPALASPFTIVPTFDSTLTALPNFAAIESTINTAIGIYEADFTDPITVHITYASMTSGLGQSNFSDYPVFYKQFLTALTADKSTADDTTAVASLASCAALTNTTCLNPVSGTDVIYLKPADALALGINLGLGSTNNDATVSVNFGITNVSRTGTQNSGFYDLLSVAMHETDEALGLGSSLGIGLTDPSPEDLFRYTSAGPRSFSLTTTVKSYFSLNGTIDIAQFNNTGSGDYGDWAGVGNTTPSALETSAMVQDATGTPGAQPNLSNAELTALDVIGYNRAAAVSSPEPSTWLLLGSALLVGLTYRRSRA